MKQITISIITFSLLCACGNNARNSHAKIELCNTQVINITTDSPHLIRTDHAKSITTEELIGMLSSVDYIKLDSSEPIGQIDKMIVTKDKILILDSFSAQQIFVFDKTGILLYRIKNKGRGPKEYISIWDMQVDTIRNEILLNDALARSYLYFSINDGQFIRREKGIANCYVTRIDSLFVNLQNNGQDFNDKENWAILVTDKDSIMYKGFEFKPLQEGDYIVNSFYRDNDGSLLYTPINSDTVYQFTSPGTAYAKYVICQEKSIWKLCDERLSEPEICKLIRKNNYTRFNGKFLSARNHAIFQIQSKWTEYIIGKTFFWDKRNDIVYEWNTTPEINKQPAIRDIINPPIAVYNNTFVSTFPSSAVPKEYRNKLSTKLKNFLDTSTENDNPILVLYTLK